MKYSPKPKSKIWTWLSESFSRKIMAILLVCSIITIVLTSIAYYFSAIHILQNQYISSANQLLAEVNQSVQRYFNQLNDVTLSLYRNDTLMENLRLHQEDYIAQDENEQAIKKILYADDAILYIYFYDPYTSTLYSFSRENMSHTQYPQLEQMSWYQDTLNAPNYFTVTPLHSFVNYTNFGTLKDATVFSINRALRNYTDGSLLAMISIAYSTAPLERICNHLDTETAYISILDKTLSPRLTTYPDLLIPETVKDAISQSEKNSDDIIYSLDGEQRILLWDKSDEIYLLKDIPLGELTKDTAQSVVKIVLILTGIFIALSFGISLYFSKTATRRLNALTMDVVAFGEGNLTINADDYGSDEIGTLAAAFNEMVARINELINREYKAKLLQKNAELQMLQARIKPHFINNALQALGTLGLKKGAKDVYLMANALARTLRYTLKSTTALIPLQKELENMNDYLYIQNILWGGQLKTIVEVEPGLEDWPVPVFILQPLVENSIKHGLDNSTQGSICVNIQQKAEDLLIIVSDNGCGIPPATLEHLQSGLSPHNTDIKLEEHIGIRNIIARMSLIYGDQSSLIIDSELNEGTTVKISLPRKEITDV